MVNLKETHQVSKRAQRPAAILPERFLNRVLNKRHELLIDLKFHSQDSLEAGVMRFEKCFQTQLP